MVAASMRSVSQVSELAGVAVGRGWAMEPWWGEAGSAEFECHRARGET